MINKDELIKGTLEFMNKYQRLPYLPDDDIAVEVENKDGEQEMRYYRAGKYIIEYYESQGGFTEYLLNEKIITSKMISEYINIPLKRLDVLLGGEATSVTKRERRAVDIFFNNDYYEELGIYSDLCKDCTKVKTCGQSYEVDIINCLKYKQSKKKK